MPSAVATPEKTGEFSGCGMRGVGQADAPEADHPAVVVGVARSRPPPAAALPAAPTPATPERRPPARRGRGTVATAIGTVRRDEQAGQARRGPPDRLTPLVPPRLRTTTILHAASRTGVQPEPLRSRYEVAAQRRCRRRTGPVRGPQPAAGATRLGGHGRMHGQKWVHVPLSPTPRPPHPDSFGARAVLPVNGRDYAIFDLNSSALTSAYDVGRLPYSIKVLLENLLRHEDSPHVSADDIVATASWGANPEAHGQAAGDAAHEIALTPERVLMQDFTGVPGVVDLAAMRDALARLRRERARVNPLVPVELVIDHSVIAERSGVASAFNENVAIEYQRNIERYKLIRWAQGAFDGFRAVPPGMGICHQVNLEFLSRVVFATPDGRAFCNTLVGTDSHTVMVNGLGVLGWGVGGDRGRGGHARRAALHAVAARRRTADLRGDQARDHGDRRRADRHRAAARPRRGRSVRRVLRAGVAALPLETRATIGNMSPEYGATCAIFPIDQVTIDYLRFTGRADEHLALVEAYAKAQGLWHDPSAPSPSTPSTSRSTWATSSPRWPARPGPRTGSRCRSAGELPGRAGPRPGQAATEPAAAPHHQLTDGDVVIAAITSCTNTSNPQVMVAAGLLARRPSSGDCAPSRGSRPRWPPARGWSWTTSTGPA